jgi:peptidoglycan-associated lipoprotein
VSVRNLYCGVIVAALGIAPAAAQGPAPTTTTTSQTAVTQDEVVLQGDATPRPALPTIYGDTGFWHLPTAETLPNRRMSFSVFKAQWDMEQGLTDANQFGLTGAIGLGDRAELFASWGVVRLDRDLRPFFVPSDTRYGGVAQDFPYMRRGWSKNLGTPLIVGGKVNFISQSRGDAMGLALRVTGEFPIGADWGGTNALVGRADVVTSREFNKQFELTGTLGGILRADPDEFNLSDGIGWGLGGRFPSRTRFSALAEWRGEWNFSQALTLRTPPYLGDDGTSAPLVSFINDPQHFNVGVVYQAANGWFAHTGLNFTPGVSDRVVGGTSINHSGWGWDVRLGWHPGVTPARERVHVIKETTTVTNTITQPAPPPPAANRNPTFSLNATCDPAVVDPGGVSRCNATATDPDGDAVTYRWSGPSGTFGTPTTAGTTWTAGQTPGNVPLTVAATDARGGTATSTVTVQVTRRIELVFEDVHFDFDRFTLRPDALKILDDAVSKLSQNPNVRITIEGHADSIGTSEYNLALGERRANSVRDYLTTRGIMNTRLRTVSYGEDRPIAENRTAQGRAQNRRAHLVVIMETVQ